MKKGEGGLRVILEEQLHISTDVEVELFLTDREMPLKCKGKVIWAKEIKPVGIRPRFFDTGIEFVELSDYNKDEIRKLVDRLLSEEKEE